MTTIERLGLRLMQRMDPEAAHELALRALRLGLGPRMAPVTSSRLRVKLAGLDLPNPVGIAAGFDKNATALHALARCGVGFVEIGAVTPRPQPGNPRPRLFRLSEDRAAINRFGFNNDGAEIVAERLAARPRGQVVGLNIGANKSSRDRAGDYVEVLGRCGPHVDFGTINVSSPNTERLRDLQGRDALSALLGRVMEAGGRLPRPIPLFVKIAPDVTGAELADIAEVAGSSGISGIVATNTTLSREGLRSRHAPESGGLSGRPLFDLATRVIVRLSALTDLPLIGVGGISSAEDAYAMLRAGATAVQLYTALTYDGLSLAPGIASGLDTLLERDGLGSVADASEAGRSDWQ